MSRTWGKKKALAADKEATAVTVGMGGREEANDA